MIKMNSLFGDDDWL